MKTYKVTFTIKIDEPISEDWLNEKWDCFTNDAKFFSIEEVTEQK